MSGAFSLARAGRWFLYSGIQEPSGGVARFYSADIGRNKPVSTEITGYTASALVFLFVVTGEERYLDAARAAARFLCDRAWDAGLRTFPFEYPSPSECSLHRAYFFDCGIIVRGLLAVWRVTREDRLLDIAVSAARGMAADFRDGAGFYPILELPDKKPAPPADHWSRLPGCYQMKSALAWWEVAEAAGEEDLRAVYLSALDEALKTFRDFLPGATENPRVMDRLHSYCYFLEALTPFLGHPNPRRSECADAFRFSIHAVSGYLREIAPEFARSDVYAQLLRARVYGRHDLKPDLLAAREEAAALAAFQAEGGPRVDGCVLFGRRNGEMAPHANPVSTAFAIQALEVWRAFEAGEEDPCRMPPI